MVIASLVAHCGQTTNSEGNVVLATLPASSSSAVEVVLDSEDDDVELVPMPKKGDAAVADCASAWSAPSHASPPGLASQRVSCDLLFLSSF